MEVNGKGLFSREINDRLKIISISSCVDLKVKFLNSLTINGGATGYGKLFVFFKYGDMFTLGLVKDENPVI